MEYPNSALASYQQPISFDEFLQRPDSYYTPGNGYSLGDRVMNWFTGNLDQNREAYNHYLDVEARNFDLAKINDARQWDLYMSSTQYQRMVKDMKAAGLNPGLVLSGSVGGAGSVPSSPYGANNSRLRNMRSDLAEQTGVGLGRFATTALAVIGMLASKGMSTSQMAARTATIAANSANKIAMEKEKLQARNGYTERSWIEDGVRVKRGYYTKV